MIKTQEFKEKKQQFIATIPDLVSAAITKKHAETLTQLTQANQFPEQIPLEIDGTLFAEDILAAMKTLKEDEDFKTAFYQGVDKAMETIQEAGWVIALLDEKDTWLVKQATLGRVVNASSGPSKSSFKLKALN